MCPSESNVSSRPFTDEEVDDLIYTAWTIIANAGEGDWDREDHRWKEAALRWRTRFHAYLDTRPHKGRQNYWR